MVCDNEVTDQLLVNFWYSWVPQSWVTQWLVSLKRGLLVGLGFQGIGLLIDETLSKPSGYNQANLYMINAHICRPDKQNQLSHKTVYSATS